LRRRRRRRHDPAHHAGRPATGDIDAGTRLERDAFAESFADSDADLGARWDELGSGQRGRKLPKRR
jgi:hypothetical protein